MTAEPTGIPKPVPGDDEDLDIPVHVDDSATGKPAANDNKATPATLADRLAAAEASAKRQREQKRASVQKQKDLEAERDKYKGEHETLSASAKKREAAIARLLDDGDESALEDLGLPKDLYERIAAARMMPEEAKAQRSMSKKERELAQQIADLKAKQDQRDQAERDQAIAWEQQHLLKLIKDDEANEDLHVYGDDWLLKRAGREASRLVKETGRKVIPFEEVIAAMREYVAPHHGKVIALHTKREAKKAEAAKSQTSTSTRKPVDDEPRGLTSDLSAQRGGPQPKAKDADDVRERAVKKLADRLAANGKK